MASQDNQTHDINTNDELHNEESGSKPIKGYRELTPTDLQRINDLKALENTVGAVVKGMSELAITDPEAVDARMVAIARTDLQKGFMCLVRAIAQPKSEL